MKYLLILALFTLIVACSGTKQVVVASQDQAETSDVVEMASNPSNSSDGEPQESPEKIEKDTIKVVQTDNTPVVAELSARKEIHNLWDELLQKHVSAEGNVDYVGFKTDYKQLLKYFKVLELELPNDKWSSEDILAYWINAYNAFTIDLILRHYPVKSIKDIKDPWGQRFWKLGPKWYHLNEIEHDILRKMDEPRIHFAIVCASFSCPKLQNKAFTVEGIDQQLTDATRTFLMDPKRNNITENSLEISKIFQWFAKDFKQNGSLIDFLNTYSDVTIANNAKKRFKDYNWDLNE